MRSCCIGIADNQIHGSALAQRALMAPLKGEDSPRWGEMSAQPTEWGVELAKP